MTFEEIACRFDAACVRLPMDEAAQAVHPSIPHPWLRFNGERYAYPLLELLAWQYNILWTPEWAALKEAERLCDKYQDGRHYWIMKIARWQYNKVILAYLTQIDERMLRLHNYGSACGARSTEFGAIHA